MGSVAKREDGKWRARYRDELNKEHSKHFTRKIDAQRWLTDVESSIQRGAYVAPNAGAVTVRAWFEKWAATQVWAQSTAKNAGYAIRGCDFADMSIKAVKPSHVQAWVKGLGIPSPEGKVLAASTIKVRFKVVRAAFRAAVLDAVIVRDPTAQVKLPRQRKAEAAMLLMSTAQVGELLDASSPEFRPFLAVCAFAGLRLGEASGLQVGDVDFLRGTIEVRRQIQGTGKANVRVEPPKHGSERTVYVPRELTDMLAIHITECGVYGDEQWLFGTGDARYTQNSAGHRFRSARSAAGLPIEAHIHGLRHYYASGLIAAGCDVVTVQRALGHASPSITLNIYSHLWPKAEDKTRAAATDMMATALGKNADQVRTSGT